MSAIRTMGRVDRAGRLHVYVVSELPPGEYEVNLEELPQEIPPPFGTVWLPSYNLKYVDPAMTLGRIDAAYPPVPAGDRPT